ncbi:MAG: hypothetical protein ACREST_05315 [Steroidobacteraceae bacterium]
MRDTRVVPARLALFVGVQVILWVASGSCRSPNRDARYEPLLGFRRRE